MYKVPLRPFDSAESDTDFRIRVALGLTPFTPVYAYGKNADLDTSEDVLIWRPGTAYNYRTAAVAISISSDNQLNDVSKTGTVYYIDSSYNQQTVTFTLNGTDARTKVNLNVNAIAVNDVLMDTVGVGNIWIYDSSDTVTAGVPQTDSKKVAYVPATYAHPQQMVYFVPTGYTAIIMRLTPWMTASATARGFDMHIYKKGMTGAAELLHASTGSTSFAASSDLPISPICVEGPSWIYAHAENATADNISIQADGELWLISSDKVAS